jgi:hypothetical protein
MSGHDAGARGGQLQLVIVGVPPMHATANVSSARG